MAGWGSKSAMLKGVIIDLLFKTQVQSYDTCGFSNPYTEQKFCIEDLGELQVHLVASSRHTAQYRGQKTWTDLSSLGSQTQGDARGQWSLQICRLLGTVRTVQLYILGRTISPGNFSLEPKGKGRRVCVGHITLPLARSLQGYWCWVASLHHCTLQQNTNGYAAHVLLWLGPRGRSL